MKYAILLLSIFLIAGTANGQDPHFSQFYANPVHLNPAFAGSINQYRVVTAYRQQWRNDIGYNTSGVSIDGIVHSENIGWGVQMVHDSQGGGVLKSQAFSGTLAYKTKITKSSFISGGMQFGYYEKRLDWSGLTFEDQLDPRFGVVDNSQEQLGRGKLVNADLSIGILYYSQRFFGGLTINHLNNPNENFTFSTDNKLPTKYTLHAGSTIKLTNTKNEEISISPNFIYQQQGTFKSINLGLYGEINALVLGSWYRINDAVIFLVGINQKKFKVGYSYDLVVSSLGTVSANSHELTVGYTFAAANKNGKARSYKGKCPKFQKNLF